MYKKIVLSAVFLALFAAAANAGTERKNDVNKMDLEETQSFFYEKGYKEGAAEGYEKGYAEAMEAARERLWKYSKRINAIENGKYLTGIGKISPPEVYQVQDGDSIRISIMGCKIEKPLSPDEILGLPTLDSGEIDTKTNGEGGIETRTTDEEEALRTNAIGITAHDRNLFSGNMHGIAADKNRHYYFVPNNRYYRQKLDQMSYIYTVQDNKLKVLFPTQHDMDEFRRTFIEGK